MFVAIGAGIIGSNLVEDLLASEEKVAALDNIDTGSTLHLNDLDGSPRVIEANCLEAIKLDSSSNDIYHSGISSSSPIYKKNPFLVGEKAVVVNSLKC